MRQHLTRYAVRPLYGVGLWQEAGLAREEPQRDQVVLRDGMLQNVRRLTESVRRLAASGFTVYTHRQVPPNDGGLALGLMALTKSLLAQGH